MGLCRDTDVLATRSPITEKTVELQATSSAAMARAGADVSTDGERTRRTVDRAQFLLARRYVSRGFRPVPDDKPMSAVPRCRRLRPDFSKNSRTAWSTSRRRAGRLISPRVIGVDARGHDAARPSRPSDDDVRLMRAAVVDDRPRRARSVHPFDRETVAREPAGAPGGLRLDLPCARPTAIIREHHIAHAIPVRTNARRWAALQIWTAPER